MKVTVNSKKGLKVVLEVIVEKQLIKNKITEKFEELKQEVNLKGFRPGKVPVEILKKQFGKAVYGEVLEKTLRETSTKALQYFENLIFSKAKLFEIIFVITKAMGWKK